MRLPGRQLGRLSTSHATGKALASQAVRLSDATQQTIDAVSQLVGKLHAAQRKQSASQSGHQPADKPLSLLVNRQVSWPAFWSVAQSVSNQVMLTQLES